MKFLLISRIDDDKALSFTQNLGKDLRRLGHHVQLYHETDNSSGISISMLGTSQMDIVVVIGGDGTILRSVQQMQRQIPLIGINWGEVGFLADLEPDTALSFLASLPQHFAVEQRMRITFAKDGVHLGDALNEALIVTTRPAKMLRFSVIVDGDPAGQFRADGLLISTPTGSTAYAMSAGGPIIDPRIRGFLLVPLAPYMLSSRPQLISSDRRVAIRLESSKPAHLVIDGQQTIELGVDDTIEVSQSPFSALFVDAGRNFFSKVNDKLRKL
ncbi:MAG: putative inorganic polyphosphate/ATP-NAD kinase [Methanoregula sp. PtaU1.Bin051]|nr:MAG: putative inorganic polyphosphate/ATP-NAD kinase [Methanoregula sp. PtaU1.Bin051]